MYRESFENENVTDFSKPENRKRMKDALSRVEKELGKDYPLIIGGQGVDKEEKIVSISPSHKETVVGRVARADEEDAEQAVEAALEAFADWKEKDPEVRAGYLFKAASIMRDRKMELSAWMIYESGKTWEEADAEVGEAIDFLEYYGRQINRVSSPPELHTNPGERNTMYRIPLGIGTVIAPWNFPLALFCGPVSAPVVTGNPVIAKPSNNTPVIAYKFMEIMEEAKFPAGVINYLPGRGREVGEYLVKHRETSFINFTGSKEVGLKINETAARITPDQKYFKKVIAETGGKDAIIVDESADLDAAVEGIIISAFSYQGQKCSACSRAIIHSDVYDEIMEKLVERTKKLQIGDCLNPDDDMGPVIDEEAYKEILKYIEIGNDEGELLIGGQAIDELDGYYIQPTIFGDVKSGARIAQEEIFGPVLSCIRVKNFAEALEVANDTVYGLVGSVYTNDREHIDWAKKEFHVGTLYFNRACVGALMGVNPWGGFKLSGTNAKTMGPEHLLLFLQGKSVSETL